MMKLAIRHLAMSSVAALALAGPVEAFGQEAAAGDTSGEIVVTAQRRAELLEDVPASITVVSAETFQNAGVRNVHELGAVAPGVQINQAGGATQPAIRGISSLTNQVGFENNVAIYIDGFYEPDMVTINADLGNVASIEILKGPQGTLYGRNATGGAILINTLPPSDTFTGKFEASYASFDDKTLSGYLSGPISESLRFSLAGYLRDTDGYIKFSEPVRSGDAAPIRQQSIRAKLAADLSPDLTATLAYSYGLTDDGRGLIFSPFQHIRPTDPQPPQLATGYARVSYNYVTQAEASVHEPTLRLEWRNGLGTLKSYTGYARRKTRFDFDTDGTYTDIAYSENTYQQDTFQQTIDYAIDAIERLDLVVGATYYDDTTKSVGPLHQTTYGPGKAFSFYADSNLKSEAYAFYADATLHLSDQLAVSLGGRYSHEEKRISMIGAGALAGTLPRTIRAVTYKKFTPRASIRYEVAPRTNVYASYSQGFRSGTFPTAVGSSALLLPIKPEIVNAFEIGLKTAQRHFRFDIAGFYYDDKDLHVSLVSQICAGTPQVCTTTSLFSNAPKARIYGVDAQLTLMPFDGLNIRLGGAYLHARYRDFPNAVGTGLDLETTVTPASNVNVTGQLQDWSNQQMARAPTFSGNIGADYEFALAGGKLQLSGNVNYTDSYVIQNPSLYGPLAGPALATKQRYRQSAYALVNAQIMWTDPSDHFYVAAFARNLTDHKYRFTFTGNARGDYSMAAWPRQFGGKVGYRF